MWAKLSGRIFFKILFFLIDFIPNNKVSKFNQSDKNVSLSVLDYHELLITAFVFSFPFSILQEKNDKE